MPDRDVDAAGGSAAAPRLALISTEWDIATVRGLCGAVPWLPRLRADGHDVKAVGSDGGAVASCDASGIGNVLQ